MRTIKFRAKRTDNGEWIYGDLFREVALLPTGSKRKSEYLGSWAIQTETPDGIKSYSVDHETVGQFADLHDKHKNEIYEGDIIADATNTVYVCTFWNGCFDFRCKDGRGIANPIAVVSSVVGNIHDNPDMMEGGER